MKKVNNTALKLLGVLLLATAFGMEKLQFW